ncbi:unnamed protein product [Caenorhabditis auriculariae]|uniref:Alpha-mannosidase n=1 Tax=Caenorhabditis auriculariae TaxID=2777116 RepID=A0A8S1GQL6_9PELO|nr:unnamed protein product [Caenorhabditis auriculariae]
MQRLLLLLLLLSAFQNSRADCSWNSCNKWSKSNDVINVHLIPHTHDDLGWIKTVDQYYYGSKPSLVPVGVQYIYNTVIDELLKNPTRRFSFAETGFLWRWYTSHGDFERHQLQKLVKTGQIELIGGGWVQNDEASSHYVDIIDQMTLGLKKLSQLFETCGKPTVAWQIDPFGHSREVANLFAEMGYTSLFFARMHYLEKAERLNNKSLEFIWNTSDDLKKLILTGGFYQDNYGPPEGFCFDALCGDDPIMDNPKLEDYNVDEKVNAFVQHVRKQASFQRTKHVMLLMGSDFQYTNANAWYSNLDKLIKYVNGNDTAKVNVFYSTPSCYVQALTEAAPKLSTKSDDFFPYASANHSYWTGYFTSRPTFKGMIRKASSTLQLAKQLDVIADLGPADDSDVEEMMEASALVQHHDAVTGTAKENVTKDYEKQLGGATNELELVVNDFINKMNPNTSSKLTLCPLLNETICPATKDKKSFWVTVFNSNSRTQSTTIIIPITGKAAHVEGPPGQIIKSTTVPTFNIPTLLGDRAPYQVHVPVSIPPLGYTTFLVNITDSAKSTLQKKFSSDEKKVSNEFLELTFDTEGLTAIFDKTTNLTHKLQPRFFYYQGVGKNGSDQTSGAYIFRPQNGSAVPVTAKSVDIVQIGSFGFLLANLMLNLNGSLGRSQKENDKLTKVTKEVVVRYLTDVSGAESATTFFTDSNGRQTLKRVRNFAPTYKYQDTEPVAANYYPITSHIYINDGNKQFTVLTDRAQGATAENGAVEIMIHRRCFYDDYFGVEEALDEPGKDGKGLVAIGKHTLFFSQPTQISAASFRPLAVEIFHEPVVAFEEFNNINRVCKKSFTRIRGRQYGLENCTPSKNNEKKRQFAGLTRDLPAALHLLTIERWHKKSILLRFEHIFQNNEDKQWSQQLTVDLKDLFIGFDIVNLNELQLAGNRNATHAVAHDGLSFTLNPMQIRTFEADIARK